MKPPRLVFQGSEVSRPDGLAEDPPVQHQTFRSRRQAPNSLFDAPIAGQYCLVEGSDGFEKGLICPVWTARSETQKLMDRPDQPRPHKTAA